MRVALILSISLAALVSSAALGAVRADTAREAVGRAPARNMQSPRQGQPTAALRGPGGTGGSQSAKSGATSQAHAALRQRMLGQIHRPAIAAPVPGRTAANVRSMGRSGFGAGGSRQAVYHSLPGHGALGGPTITRSTAKGLSGVRQRP
jgi:hypothetical protein